MHWQLVASYSTVNYTDFFCSAETKIAKLSNSVELDEAVHNEPPRLDLH